MLEQVNYTESSKAKPAVSAKLARSAMRAWTFGQIKKQGGLCPLCKKPIDLQVRGNKSDYVVDHCHESGLIRAVLHRSCNSSEGKIVNAAGRWGAKSTKYADVIPYLRSVVEYLEYHQANPSNLTYPDHKTPEEKAQRVRTKRNTAAAIRRAKQKVKEYNE